MHIEIEATNRCNTKCFHCPHEAISRPLGTMEWNTFNAIFDQVLRGGQEVSVEFAGMGEPLLNPHIYQFVSHISDRAKTSLTTNGAALTPQNTQRLMEAGLDCLTVSFNGFDKPSYELMMGGLPFERAEMHLQSAVDMSRGKRMKVAANVSVTKQTCKVLKEIRRYLVGAGVDAILFSKCHNRGGNLHTPQVCDTPMAPLSGGLRCDIFATTLFVAWNGDVLSCCHDLGGANYLGNLMKDSLEMVLGHQQRIKEEGVDFEMCRRCNDMCRYMNAPTPENSPLSEWIYRLYTGEDERTGWLIRRVQELTAVVAEKDETIERLTTQVRDGEVRWYEFQMSTGGRFLKKLQNYRRILAPAGTRRERLLHFVLDEERKPKRTDD